MAGFKMKQWILSRKGADYEYLSKELNIDPVAVRILLNRGITELDKMREFLSDDISASFGYKGLPNLDKAVETIEFARANNLSCRVIGDYDADGVCSTAILVKGLRIYGLSTDYAIPNRLLDGYGINENIVKNAIDDNIGLIVTCDNGISAGKTIDSAVAAGIKVVVTDHHTVNKDEIPLKAHALVNPRMEENEYPFPDICGAFVAFKLLCALFEDDESFERIKYELLELAAVATVTDVMPLVGENRNIVKWLLSRLKNPINEGLKDLATACKIGNKSTKCKCTDIGFQIGPCINATGRIDVADRAVNLFLSDNGEERSEIVNKLLKLNEERKIMTEECINQGIDAIENASSEENLDDILVLYLPKCHVSVCGLVAGKIRERYYRPTLVLTDSVAGLTGSGRSVDEYDMIAGITECADLLSKFGGHKMACGLSLDKDNLYAFTRRINANSTLTKEDLCAKIIIDADMPFSYVNEKVIGDLARLEPFGAGNTTPVFAVRNMKVIKGRRTGTESQHLFVTVLDNNKILRTLKCWNRAEEFDEFLSENVSESARGDFYSYSGMKEELYITVSYYPEIYTYNGTSNIDFILKDYKKS